MHVSLFQGCGGVGFVDQEFMEKMFAALQQRQPDCGLTAES